MIGQLVFAPKGRGRAVPGRLYGLPVLRVEVDRSGLWGERRLRRGGRELRRRGVLRVLAPWDLGQLSPLERFGLRPVDPEPFVRAQAAPLALEVLDRQGLAPHQATVALRGLRADWEMARTAARLCPEVRNIVIDAPRGGEELARWLRSEFGMPVLPPDERGQAALAFQEGTSIQEEGTLELYGARPRLAGLTLSVPELEEEDRENLPLLAALWEGGRLAPEDIKIT